VCQVISGKAIVFCPLITVSVLPPNRRVQLTPLRGRKIVAILKSGFVRKLISLYQCGAADAQHVGRQSINIFSLAMPVNVCYDWLYSNPT
jgi:hypothetical protein